jgi:predicted nucleotidyltransferase
MSATDQEESSPIEISLSRVVAAVTDLDGVVGISLGGSTSMGLADEASDLDVYVYWREPLAATADRQERLSRIAGVENVEVDIRMWGLEDHLQSGDRSVELIYVDLDDLQAEVERAYGEGICDEGFVTARFAYLVYGHLLYDPTGELSELQARLLSAYPEPTRRLLLQDNPKRLRIYLDHLRLALARGDMLAVQQRRYTIQMVFFNLLFALNRRYHPGEKRLLAHSEQCPIRPYECAARWEHSTRLVAADFALAESLSTLVEELCDLAAQDSASEAS